MGMKAAELNGSEAEKYKVRVDALRNMARTGV
jgi:hypothetical protein